MTWLNPISLRAGFTSLEDAGFVRESRRKNEAARRFALTEIDKLKLPYAQNPKGNFFWLKVGAGHRDLPAKLAKSNVYIACLSAARPLRFRLDARDRRHNGGNASLCEDKATDLQKLKLQETNEMKKLLLTAINVLGV
jgi:histidinol-phosphate/aromatic aminotransferase/cobyric acid decarboxylase-like protein